ncbi:MAG TPA: hypothetical protein VF006_00095 [Longimicrobium sp.]
MTRRHPVSHRTAFSAGAASIVRSAAVRAALLLAALAGSIGACGPDRGGAGAAAEGERSVGQGVLGARPGVTLAEYVAMPASERLDAPEKDEAFGTTGKGVAVEVDLRATGLQGKSLPFAYSLHDARNDLPFISRTIPVTPDAREWSRRGHVWLPVPAPGSYYVRVILNDSTGRRTDGPRTEAFTIQ